MWTWASTKAGITVLPLSSTRAAPGGTITSPRRPTAVMRPLSTTTVESAIGVPPSPVMSRAPSNTVTGTCARAASPAANMKQLANMRTEAIRLARCMDKSSDIN